MCRAGCWIGNMSSICRRPTPDCCNGLKQVLKKDKKCLCVIVVDKNDPQLGLKINATLALNLPSVCHAPANVTQCPELLQLAPNSTDAKVFYKSGTTPADEGKPASASGGSGQNISSSGSSSSNSGKAWFGIAEIVCLGFLFFTIVVQF